MFAEVRKIYPDDPRLSDPAFAARHAAFERWYRNFLSQKYIKEVTRMKKTTEECVRPDGRNLLSGDTSVQHAVQLQSCDLATEETCAHCGKKLSFSRMLRCDDPKRWENGAAYVDGGGQLCGDCARCIYSGENRFAMWGS